MVMSIENFVKSLNQNQLEFFNERAATREYEGNMDPITAEYLAMDDTIKYYGTEQSYI
jgi:hypothetical protein